MGCSRTQAWHHHRHQRGRFERACSSTCRRTTRRPIGLKEPPVTTPAPGRAPWSPTCRPASLPSEGLGSRVRRRATRKRLGRNFATAVIDKIETPTQRRKRFTVANWTQPSQRVPTHIDRDPVRPPPMKDGAAGFAPTAPGIVPVGAAGFRSPSGLGLAVQTRAARPPSPRRPAGLAAAFLVTLTRDSASSGQRRRTDSRRRAATPLAVVRVVRNSKGDGAAIAFSVEL